MAVLYVATLALSAMLLFAIQPIAGKAVLPALGGTPAVWTTCLAFFQTVLLAGYACAHGLVWKRPGVSRWLFPGLLLASWWLAPGSLTVDHMPEGTSPAPWLLGWLLVRLGLPVLALTMSAPLLQAWFARTGRDGVRDPYPLYAASNIGSMIGLLGYPLWVESRLGLTRQVQGWSAGLLVLAALVALCAWPSWREEGQGNSARWDENIGASQWFRWMALAVVPSLLLVGVTQYITTDLAAVPLLWALPLALYLLTFVIAFSSLAARATLVARRVFPILLMLLAPALAVGLVQPWWIPVHMLALFFGALSCHGTMAAERPRPERLTAFYLAVATGGALGGLFASLVAPLVFDRIAEYPIALFAAAALPLWSREPNPGRRLALPVVVFATTALLVRDVGGLGTSALGALGIMLICGLVALTCWRHNRRPVTFTLTLGAAVAGCGLADARDGGLLWRDRDFFGVLRVTRDDQAGCVRLFHGSTLHGEQAMDPGQKREPRSYFTRTGPIGGVFTAMAERPAPLRRVVIVGLGVGSLAAYAQPSEHWTFLELDPAVVRIASNSRYFTFLSDCRADRLEIQAGDARRLLAEEARVKADLIVLDAFGSDAVPVHLLTREALRLYLDRLAPGGLLAFNITNRYLDLEPVLGALAASEGLTARVRHDLRINATEKREGKQPTIWAVLARNEADLGALADDPRWRPAQRQGQRAWTDDHANPLECLTFRSRLPRSPAVGASGAR